MKELSKPPEVNQIRKPEIENFKSIKPKSDMSVKDAKSFVDNLFKGEQELKDGSNTASDVPSGKFDSTEGNTQGGSYGELKAREDREGKERHHMPADSVNGLERDDGPAVVMDAADHRQTASCGNSKEAQEYRAAQGKLIEEGKFREAYKMDVDDIRAKFGSKYDEAIAQADKYIDKLETEGKI